MNEPDNTEQNTRPNRPPTWAELYEGTADTVPAGYQLATPPTAEAVPTEMPLAGVQPATQAPTVVNNITVAAASGVGLARNDKSLAVAYLLLLTLGFFGAHHFYLGKPGRGVAWLCTGGLFLFGLALDLFTLPSQVKAINARRRVGL